MIALFLKALTVLLFLPRTEVIQEANPIDARPTHANAMLKSRIHFYAEITNIMNMRYKTIADIDINVAQMNSPSDTHSALHVHHH